MKCPKCELVTSNSKDFCPRCSFDLRPQKIALGLEINQEERSKEAKSSRPIQSNLPTTPTPVLKQKQETETYQHLFVDEEELFASTIQSKSRQPNMISGNLTDESINKDLIEEDLSELLAALENIEQQTALCQKPLHRGKDLTLDDLKDAAANLESEQQLDPSNPVVEDLELQSVPNKSNPPVMVLAEDEALLEQQLDQMLDDFDLNVATAKEGKKVSSQIINSLEGELEIIFEDEEVTDLSRTSEEEADQAIFRAPQNEAPTLEELATRLSQLHPETTQPVDKPNITQDIYPDEYQPINQGETKVTSDRVKTSLDRIQLLLSCNRLPNPDTEEGQLLHIVLNLLAESYGVSLSTFLQDPEYLNQQFNANQPKLKHELTDSEPLWQKITDELLASCDSPSEEVEITINKQLDTTTVEATDLIFELAAEELKYPHRTVSSYQKVSVPLKPQIDNKLLQKAIETYETEQSEVEYRLPEAINSSANSAGQFDLKLHYIEKPAGLFRASLACLTDILLCLAISGVLFWNIAIPADLRADLLSYRWPPSALLSPLLLKFLFITGTCWLLVNSILITISGQTLGGQLLKLMVVNNRSELPYSTQAVVRSSARAITMLTCGLIEIPFMLKGRRSLADRLAGTKLIVLDEDDQLE